MEKHNQLINVSRETAGLRLSHTVSLQEAGRPALETQLKDKQREDMRVGSRAACSPAASWAAAAICPHRY